MDGGLQGYVRIGLLRCYDSVVANAASDGYVIGLWDRGSEKEHGLYKARPSAGGVGSATRHGNECGNTPSS